MIIFLWHSPCVLIGLVKTDISEIYLALEILVILRTVLATFIFSYAWKRLKQESQASYEQEYK